ncbi:MAG: acyl-CoA dehydrogenase family protein [Acidimicrobiia bacterium]
MSPTVDDYRAAARAWLPANLERIDARVKRVRGIHNENPEEFVRARAIQRRLFDGGFAGITWPKEYGGQGLSADHERVFVEEAEHFELPDFSVLQPTTFGVCGPTLLRHGSEALKKRHIPRILSGEELWCQFFSEPEAGSDMAASRTTAVRDGARWILNGSKVWSSLAHFADYGLCLARTNWDVPKHAGLSWFVVPTNAPGLTINLIKELNGNTGFCQEFFDDVELPIDALVGEENQGWSIVATSLLAAERGAGRVERSAPSFAAALAPDIVDLARRRGVLGDPNVRQRIASVMTHQFAYEALVVRTDQRMAITGDINSGEAAYPKLGRATWNADRAKLLMEIGEASTVAWHHDDLASRSDALKFLNGRLESIAGGTSEVQRNGIAERVLGLPREPSFDRDKPFAQVIRDAGNWTGR